jgi:hypothetical protein
LTTAMSVATTLIQKTVVHPKPSIAAPKSGPVLGRLDVRLTITPTDASIPRIGKRSALSRERISAAVTVAGGAVGGSGEPGVEVQPP